MDVIRQLQKDLRKKITLLKGYFANFNPALFHLCLDNVEMNGVWLPSVLKLNSQWDFEGTYMVPMNYKD